MKLSGILLSIFATASAFTLNSFELASPVGIEGRITSGENATEGQFPHQVGLFLDSDNPHFNWCGGCLIGNEWVLTAAHCLMGVNAVTVFLGGTIRGQAEQERYVAKENFIIHRGYNSETFRDDIALIKIPYVHSSQKIKIIKLPSLLKDVHSSYTNKFAIASGWGKTSDKNEFVTSHLQWARLQIISNDVCRNTFSFVPDASLCVATPEFVSPCFGDSGGPLVLEDDGTLIGAFSFLYINGCEFGLPAAYVRLTNYLDWIYYHTGFERIWASYSNMSLKWVYNVRQQDCGKTVQALRMSIARTENLSYLAKLGKGDFQTEHYRTTKGFNVAASSHIGIVMASITRAL